MPKKWLITGCAGFIGSHLTRALLNLSQTVVGVDNFSSGYKKNLDLIKKEVKENWDNFTFVDGDISDYQLCTELCNNVDVILHQAALGSVPRSIDNPIRTNNSNIVGQLNILTAAKEQKVKRVVYASSSSVYGDDESLPKKEDRTGTPLSPYAITKKTNELYGKVFYDIYGLETIGLRYFNVFGPRQNPLGPYAAVIPKWISTLQSNQDAIIFGDGSTSRDFCFVENVIQINILAATTNNQKAFGKIFNVAYGHKTSLDELFIMICNSLNISDKKAIYKEFRPGDMRHSLADISQAREILGYGPSYSIKEGINITTKWFTENR